MDALQTGAVQTGAVQRYPLHMTYGAARVILNEEGSCLEYTPATGKLEVVLRSRGLLLSGLVMITVYDAQTTISQYLGTRFHLFFDSEYWRHLIAHHASLMCYEILGTPTYVYSQGGNNTGRHDVSFLSTASPRTGSGKKIKFVFMRTTVEQGLSYDRAILREQEYIHEYTNAAADNAGLRHSTTTPDRTRSQLNAAVNHTAGLMYHRGNLAALKERRLAVMMGLHPRLGESSALQRLDKDLLKGICDGDV